MNKYLQHKFLLNQIFGSCTKSVEIPKFGKNRTTRTTIVHGLHTFHGPGSVVGIATGYGQDGPGINSRWGASFPAPVQTGPGAHPASCTMGTGSFPGVKRGRGVTLTLRPLLVPWSRKGRAIPLLPLWVVRPVQSLSACTRVYFTFTHISKCTSQETGFTHPLETSFEQNLCYVINTHTMRAPPLPPKYSMGKFYFGAYQFNITNT